MILSALALFTSLQIHAQNVDRHCVAILLREGIQSNKCLAADESLDTLTDATWNRLICSMETFTLEGRSFQHDEESGNLHFDECSWEVRGHSE